MANKSIARMIIENKDNINSTTNKYGIAVQKLLHYDFPCLRVGMTNIANMLRALIQINIVSPVKNNLLLQKKNQKNLLYFMSASKLNIGLAGSLCHTKEVVSNICLSFPL